MTMMLVISDNGNGYDVPFGDGDVDCGAAAADDGYDDHFDDDDDDDDDDDGDDEDCPGASDDDDGENTEPPKTGLGSFFACQEFVTCGALHRKIPEAAAQTSRCMLFKSERPLGSNLDKPDNLQDPTSSAKFGWPFAGAGEPLGWGRGCLAVLVPNYGSWVLLRLIHW